MFPMSHLDNKLSSHEHFNNGFQMRALYNSSKDLSHLQRSIAAYETGLRLLENIGPEHAADMSTLAGNYLTKFKRTEELDDINRSITLMEEVLLLTPTDDQIRPRRLVELGLCQAARFSSTGQIVDLKDAINHYEEAQALCGPDISDNDRSAFLNQKALLINMLYDQTFSVPDHDRGIAYAIEALSIAPDDTGIMETLAIALTHRYRRSSDREDLDKSLKLFARAVELVPSDAPQYAELLQSYGESLRERFELLGDIEDLQLAITVTSDALQVTSDPPSLRHTLMQNKALFLGRRFQHSGSVGRPDSIKDLDDALALTREILRESPLDHPFRPNWLESHGNRLGMLFEATDDAKALDEAIRFTGEAVAIASNQEVSYTYKLINYGNWLHERFERNLRIQDLNDAIDATDEAVNRITETDRNKARWQNRLGSLLRRRGQATGDARDLNHAIEILEVAVNSTPKGDVDRPARLRNLAESYSSRHDAGKLTDDLDKSISNMQMALDETPKDHPTVPDLLTDLAMRFHRRAEKQGDGCWNDLQNAIEKYETSLELAHQHPSGKVSALNGLGMALKLRFQLFEPEGEPGDDINRSIEMLREALQYLDKENRFRSVILHDLGLALEYRYEEPELRHPGDLEDSLSSFIECFRSQYCEPWYRISSARNAAGVLLYLSRLEEAVELLKDAIQLFPSYTPRFLPHSDQQRLVSRLSGLASWSVSVALNAGIDPYEALMLLEGGRGVIASLLMETRMDMSMLDPDTAAEFRKARERLEAQSANTGVSGLGMDMETKTTKSRYIAESQGAFTAEEELQRVIEKIQSDPMSQDFFKPPSLDALMDVLDDDTVVVINTSRYRSDAFVINKRLGTALVQLPNLKQEDISANVNRLQSSRPHIDLVLLEWLWDAIVKSIMDKCEFHEPPTEGTLPRVIWVLAGALSRLPIHAAGRHMKGNEETAMDRVMSSYSSSLRSFVYSKKAPSRLTSESHPRSGSKDKALLVAMGKTPGEPRLKDLPFATQEVEILQKLCDSLSLQPVRLPVQSREAVLGQLGSLFFHFAGHGVSDPLDPAQSGLRLEDGLLTVADIQSHKMGEEVPFLGYLSACLTGANDVDELVDEGIHLISACQLAGFRHVIGALWQVYDDSCAKVSESVYRCIVEKGVTDRSVCVALHEAIISLRDDWVAQQGSTRRDMADLPNISVLELSDDPEEDEERDGTLILGKSRRTRLVRADWIPYVHYGP